MSRSGWSKRSRSGATPAPCEPPQGPGIHVYLFWSKEGERYLSHTSGRVTAEELCISAAEAVGITPLCHVLFALYNPQSHCWYSPNHDFSPDNSSLVLHYCMRFYFRNWHGLNKKEPIVSRYALRSGTSPGGSPLLEITSLEYLFSQAKYEFVNEVVQMEDVQSEEELSRFKNESLGMAVLQLSHQAMQTGCTLQEVAEKVSYLRCIPRSFAKHISKDNFLAKIKIRGLFAEFVRTFQQHTVDKGRLGAHEIMYKYMSTLEHLVPRFGTETFSVPHLELREDGDGSYSDTTHAQGGASKDNFVGPATHEIMVSGTKGIQWRKVSVQKAQENTYLRNDYMKKTKQQSRQPNANTPNKWTSFCDFPEITHIAITGDKVCISTLDNCCMEVEMNSSQEARSFISLLDGYNRLTAFAHHYLCHEVAPPRVVLSVANGLHGPMHDDFVLLKLKKEAAEEGAFLVRWSALDYRRIILAVLSKNETGSKPSHKQFRIQLKGSMFCLEGWDREFSSIKELTESLKTFILKSGSDSFTVRKCCLPKQGELSNLLVVRQGVRTDTLSLNMTQLRFHQIKDRDIVQKQHLGRGTRTNIYSGQLLVRGGGENEDDKFNNNSADRKGIQVVLKILDQSDKDIDIGFLETASLMSQVSHSHLVFVHGVSVKGSENIMVEEFVEFGPLDVFLRKEKASVTPQWKFIVARQLASALNYLETKRLVHGNVCAKNILVVRRGLEHGTTPFVKLSDPGIALSVLSREERLERIPWIAPECVDSGAPIGSAADQWSFGVTLLEICNNGDLPMSGSTLSEKERFYQQKGRLAEPSSQELASFISMCLTYDPVERPSFRTVLRELTEIMIKNPDISPSEILPITDPSVFYKRYLKKMRDLGEARVERMEDFQKKGEDLNKMLSECRRKLAEAQKKVQELSTSSTDDAKAELSKAQAEEKKLKKEERDWEKKLAEHNREEKKMPWNVDTLSKEGFSKSVVNVKPDSADETEEEKEQKHKNFVEKNEKQIKHFGMLRRWDDSQKYLSDNPHLVCEETANYLVIMCIDLEVEEKHALMEQVAHQTIVMQFILELAKSLKVDPRGCFRQFFAKIKTADVQYQDAFNDELESFKERVRGRAKIRIEKAMKEYEEEERQKRLGPGGLDPVEVYESLPAEMQKCFDDKDIQMLQDAISKMDPTEAKLHMKRCIDSGLWVPNSRTDDGDEKEEDATYEEVKLEQEEAKKE